MNGERLFEAGFGQAVVRKDARVEDTVAEVAHEAGVEPVHHFIDARPRAQVPRIGRRADQVGEVFEDCGAFREHKVAMLEHRHGLVRVELRERLALVFSAEEVDPDHLQREVRFGGEQDHRSASCRCGIIVKPHRLGGSGFGIFGGHGEVSLSLLFCRPASLTSRSVRV